MDTALLGLRLYHDFISESMEAEIIREIDAQEWVVDYNRRLQYYGYPNELEAPYDLIQIPVPILQLIHQLSQNLVEQKVITMQPDQVIINEYAP